MFLSRDFCMEKFLPREVTIFVKKLKALIFYKQVAQRATIAHLSPMCQHPFISNKPASKVIKNLNSFQIREQLFFQGLVPPMSAV